MLKVIHVNMTKYNNTHKGKYNKTTIYKLKV